MKLLYLHQYYSFPTSNGGTRSHDLATAFHEKGIEVTIVTTARKMKQCEGQTSRWHYFEENGIKYYALKSDYSNQMSFMRRIWSFISFVYYASFKIIKINADVVLATSTPLTIAIPALLKKRFQGTPFIFEVRDVWPEVPIKMGFIKNRLAQKVLRWFEVHTYRRASWIVPLSTGMLADIQQRYTGDKFTVIPNISETTRFQNITENNGIKIPDTEGKRVVLYCGTVGKVNGLKYLVDLAKETKDIDPNVIYIVYGNGNEYDLVTSYAEANGVSNVNMYFMGVVRKNDLPYIYSHSTVGSSFVIDIPILWDNSANKFFDTLASGRPMLINHKGWQAETIHKYNCGYVLPPMIDKKAAADFVNYINDNILIELQSVNAKALADNSYSLEIATVKYLQIFKTINV